VTAAGLHPAEKSSILLSRTARRAPVSSRGLYPQPPGSTLGRRTNHTARRSGGSAGPDKTERQSSTLWCCTNAR